MRNATAPVILVLIVITPVFFVGMELPTSFQSNTMPEDIPEEILQETEFRDSLLEEDVELKMMFFTETVSSESGLYYVCRRGTDAVAYFGASMVKYLSGGTVFTLEFPGSSAVIPQGENATGSTTNYLYGNDPSKWKAGIKDCLMLRYPELYPGIDLMYKIHEGNLKYEFVVQPLADPERIQLDYSDADLLEILYDNLIITKGESRMEDGDLRVFQNSNCVTNVDCEYYLNTMGNLGFSLGVYDSHRELVIDPVILVYSTFLGGSGSEIGYSVAIEGENAYITGQSSSSDFPLKNAFDSTHNGPYDCFVAKFATDGQSIIYSTFIGGTSAEYGRGIAIEKGYAYISGTTTSSDFPLVNAFDSNFTGTDECFVTKLAVDGQSLVYSTFLGGQYGGETAWAIAVQEGYAYVVGSTQSPDFPVINALSETYGGGGDCFLAKFAADGQSLLYSTYLGGSSQDKGYGIAVEDSCAYITGETQSSDFPTINAYDSILGGFLDGFVTKFAADGESLQYSTYLGGSSAEKSYGIAVEEGCAYVTGETYSSDFPTINAFDSTRGGAGDAFVTKIAADGQALYYSSYLGGSDDDFGRGIVVENGFVSTVGYTSSNNFPTKDAHDSSFGGTYDGFVTQIEDDGRSLIYSTFLGGSGYDAALAIAVENRSAYITGSTSSTNFPTRKAFDSALNGSDDCFLTILFHDSDGDGLTDSQEISLGTDCYCVDTDNDNYLDGYEIECGTDPLDPDHYPGMHHDLQYSSYLGGSLDDMGYDIAVEDSFMYITGKTHSGTFPTVNAIDGTHNGMGDVYVLKLTEDGSSIVYSTFIGGSDNELGKAIAVSDGWVWVTGYTYSTDFPTVNAYDATHNDDRDCFALRLTPSGTSLWFSTFLGGSGDDFGEDVAVWNNLAYITGSTTSAGYPVTTGAFDESHNGQQDAFVTKISSDGSTLVYSTFVGGTQNDYGHGIAVEDAYAYITGTTVSAFPLNNPYDGTHDVGYDGFVSKISLDGTSLIFSTYIGAESYDNPQDIAVEGGNAYIVGITGSLLFPTVHAYCSSHHGDTRDVFVTKFAADGQSLDYSTFLGGTGADYGLAISVENGYAGVTGYTNSTDYPTTFNQPSGDVDECFITMLSKHGQSVIYSTVLGGEGDDRGQGIAVHDGTMYATGLTRSNHFPTHIPFDSSYNGNWDAFVAVLGLDSDRDGVCDSWENMLGTDPNWIDTDDDNFLDYYEFVYGSNATDPEDYPAMPQVWYEALYKDLDGNSTLIQQIKDWLDGNHTAIETLFTYVEGNATLLLDTVDALEGNATELAVVAALATANYDWLEQLNATAITNLTEIREVLNQLGATVGDADYDGLDDIDELDIGTDLQCIDTDCDNLNDAFEVKIGTDPLDDDSDADTYLDGIEIIAGTDPLDPSDYPGATTTTTSTGTTTTSTTSSQPDGFSPMMLALFIGGVAIGAVVLLIFLLRKRRMSS